MVRGARARLGWVLLVAVGCAKAAKEDSSAGFGAPPAATGEASAAAHDEMDRGLETGAPAEAPADDGKVQGRGGEGWKGAVPSERATRESALTLPNVQSCQATCVDRGATRGVGAQQLDTECRTECKKQCLDQCEVGTTVTKKACTMDCERQVARMR